MVKVFSCDKLGQNAEPVCSWTEDDAEDIIMGLYSDGYPAVCAELPMFCGDVIYQVETERDGLVSYDWYRVQFSD